MTIGPVMVFRKCRTPVRDARWGTNDPEGVQRQSPAGI